MVSVDLTKRDGINDTIPPSPYIVQSTGKWDGVDGYYTSFSISVGTPPQSFRVFPATIDSVVTVPIPEGCQAPALSQWSGCGDSRGVNAVNGRSSQGFAYTTALELNIYKLFQYQNEYTTETGPFFQEKVTMFNGSGVSIQINNTIVAGQSSFWFWLGTLGLGSTAGNYSQNQLVAPSFLSMMKTQSVIPSLSYSYTAGQHYNNIHGSLILGGYDSSRQSGSIVTMPVDTSNGINKLNIPISSIIAFNGTNGHSQDVVLTDSITASIDSSLSHMWLPGDTCDKIADAFGLTYDSSTALYVVNDTQHDTLSKRNASLELVLGKLGSGSSGSTNIVMHYNSLDMQAGWPIYANSTNYFPMKRASNSSQYTLGRAFLQESYLVVDWERNNFTIGPVVPPTGSADIRSITSPTPSASTSPFPTTSTSPDSSGSSGSVSGGVIAGAIIGALVIAAIGIGFFLWRRRKTGKRFSFTNRKSTASQPPPYDQGAEWYSGNKEDNSGAGETKLPAAHISEMYDESARHELTSDNVRKLEELAQQRELMSTPVAELHGDVAGSELEDVTSNRTRDSVGSAGRSTTRSSIIASPTRTSVLGPDRARLDHVFEME